MPNRAAKNERSLALRSLLTSTECSSDPTDYLLFKSWIRTIQACLSRTEDESAVSRPFPNPQLQHLTKLIHTHFSRSFDVFQSYFSSFVNVIRHPTAFFNAAENTANSVTLNGILGRIRNVNRQQLVSAGIISAEVLGFFTVGEIIGRLKLVGYRGDVEHH